MEEVNSYPKVECSDHDFSDKQMGLKTTEVIEGELHLFYQCSACGRTRQLKPEEGERTQ